MDVFQLLEEQRQWTCNDCTWTGNARAMLVAPNPFQPVALILGCPSCKSVNCFTEVEDEEY